MAHSVLRPLNHTVCRFGVQAMRQNSTYNTIVHLTGNVNVFVTVTFLRHVLLWSRYNSCLSVIH